MTALQRSIGLLFGSALVFATACGVAADESLDASARPADAAIDARPDAFPYPDAHPPSPVEVHITADNAYGFGYGNAGTMSNYFGGVENTTAGQIFNCGSDGVESYTVPAADADVGNYLYVVTWADKATSQGVLGQFSREGVGTPVYTGTGDWEVCATGQDYSPGSGGPDLATINTQISNCNAGNTDPVTTSQGWVDSTGTVNGQLAVGEDNSTARSAVVPGNEFPITCASLIDTDAHWMWFNWDPTNMTWPQQSPFIWPGGGATNPDGQFLIFRLGAAVID
jgi:hypothetical protein